ncbi:GNAT family N-acetyltransferase [Paucibacter sp. APW11]|uniref:GNAT family N-acetyltransferase n=1 Tax=Roseateles aquae TaxID=3077235 RepID=A0ABU3PIR0_9BURK|nr:GNAT family N-acetyltransferase [Paucibacter sp. APW11]MDT9002434.1 GNAT family N-acetyltransferase [Paucibacter sp. APW11]
MPEHAGIRIQRAGPADAARLLPLCMAHAQYERYALCFDAQWSARTAEALRSGRLRAWLLLAGEAALGYASATLDHATLNAAPFLHMDCLYLQESARGQGHGARLLQAVCAEALACGCTQLQWQTPAWNESAQRFYRREGALMQLKQRFALALV